MPPSDKHLSVFNITGLNESEVWRIGEDTRPRPLLARADIEGRSIIESHLALEEDNIPYRHANIINWANEPSEIRLKAIELAQRAILKLR